MAASMSPFVSCNARLQSIIPAPVRSRSSLTSAAEISAIRVFLRRRDSILRLCGPFVLRVDARRHRDRLALGVRLDGGTLFDQFGLDDLEIALGRGRRSGTVAVAI